MLPAPAASNKASRRSSTKASAPLASAAGDEEVNPFPVDNPQTDDVSFDPLASPPKRSTAKGTPMPVQSPPLAVANTTAAPAPAPVTSDVIADFDWLLSGAKKSAPAPAATAAATAAAAAGPDLTVPEGGDPFDVYWTGGGAPRPLPDSDPWPTTHVAPASNTAAADSDDEAPAQSAAVVRKKPGQASAAAAAAAAATDKKAGAAKKVAAAKKPADDSDDDRDQKALSEAHATATAAPAEAKKSGPFTVKVDVLKFMKKGCSLLKFGNYGYPHFRQFQISSDNKKLQWFSAGKAMTDSQIDLRDVEEIVVGQHTDKFGKHKEVTQLEKSSFSVFYNYRKKTLDVIAKDPNEFTVWTKGLAELVRRAQKNENLSQISELVLDLTMLPIRRTNADIVDRTTGKSIVDLIAGSGAAAGAGAGGAEDTHDKGRYKAIGENLQYMRKRIVKYADKLKQSQYYMSPQHNTMKELLKKLQEAAGKVADAFHAGQFGVCDDELWRANVDLESLKNMMKAIDASID